MANLLPSFRMLLKRAYKTCGYEYPDALGHLRYATLEKNSQSPKKDFDYIQPFCFNQ